MGRRGPAPKSDSLRMLDGNPSKRPLKDKPTGAKPQDVPTCPAWLSPEAKREWRRVTPELIRLGLVTRLDQVAIAGYCISYSCWRRCQEVLIAQGNVYVTNRGQIRPRPEVEIARMSGDTMKSLASELGLTPASRECIHMAQPGREIDPMEALLDGANQGGKR